MRARDLAAGLLGTTLFASALAHETWMMPSVFSAKVGEVVRFDVSSGLAFPRLESAIKAERVATAAYRLGQDVAEMKSLTTTGTSLVLRQAFPKGGVATVRMDLKPKDIEQTDDEVAEYLDEIDATADIRSIWAGQKGRVPWKELYTKHAKTFVAVGQAPPDRSWAIGVGAELELVPTTSPFTIEAGHEFTVELQANSKPLPNLPVGLLMEGASNRVFRTTNADGRATFPIATTGRAMLFAVRLRLANDGRSWRSDFCTMTFAAHGTSSAAPTLEQIRSAKATGLYEGAPYVKGGASRPRVELLGKLTATGNLDDRPGEERVAFLAETSGGTGVQVFLAVFGLRGGKVAKLGAVHVGDRVQLRELAIERNTIVLDVVRAGPGDPSCCPTELARTSYRLDHGELKSIASEVKGTLSLAAIGDVEWTLEEIDGLPLVPGGKAPTFKVSGGNASGFGGCNRYTGPVTERAPGNVSVGELASTRMACADAQMSLEDGFLACLEHVTTYAFLEGRLALGWQDGSRSGLLLFGR